MKTISLTKLNNLLLAIELQVTNVAKTLLKAKTATNKKAAPAEAAKVAAP